MKIVVVGAGGVGGYFGARLAADGNEVTFVARGAHAEAMRRDGLKLLSPLGDLLIRPVRLLADPLATGLVDIVLLSVKMYDLEAAAELIRPLLQIDTAVVPLQNGVEAVELLGRRLGRRYVCGGIAYISAAIEAPGVVRHAGGAARLVLGELAPSDSWRLETLQAACTGAGIEAELAPDITLELWRKLIFLAPFAAATCLARAPIGVVRADAERWQAFRAMVEEAVAVACARGVRLPADTTAERIAFTQALPAAMCSSMLHDLEAGRRLELDWLTGAVVRLGREAGVATPASEAAYAALQPFAAGTA